MLAAILTVSRGIDEDLTMIFAKGAPICEVNVRTRQIEFHTHHERNISSSGVVCALQREHLFHKLTVLI